MKKQYLFVTGRKITGVSICKKNCMQFIQTIIVSTLWFNNDYMHL